MGKLYPQQKVAIMADKSQRGNKSKGKKPGEFKKAKRLSQQIRKGVAHASVTVPEQITQSKDKNRHTDNDS